MLLISSQSPSSPTWKNTKTINKQLYLILLCLSDTDHMFYIDHMFYSFTKFQYISLLYPHTNLHPGQFQTIIETLQDSRWKTMAKSHGVKHVTACFISFLMPFLVCYCHPLDVAVTKRKWHQKTYKACCYMHHTMRFCHPLLFAILFRNVSNNWQRRVVTDTSKNTLTISNQ